MNQFPVTEFESFLNDNKKLRMVKNKGPWHIELLPDEKPYHPEVLLKNISNEMYLIGDLHIGDPIENWTDKRDKIIATINATVSKDDHLLIVGDLSAHTNTANLDDVKNTIAMLNCRNLYLILGNNDQYDIDTYVKMGFLTVTDKVYWKNYVITHCPIPVYGNQINIHGHMHEEIQYINVDWHNHINIWDDQYVPIKLGKAIELFNSGYYKGVTINDKEELEYHKKEKYFGTEESIIVESATNGKVFTVTKTSSSTEKRKYINSMRAINDGITGPDKIYVRPEGNPPISEHIKIYNDKSFLYGEIMKVNNIPVTYCELWEYRDDVACLSIATRSGKQYRHKGYASELVTHCKDWLNNQSQYTRLFWDAEVENIPSQRLAEKNGFVFDITYDREGKKYNSYVYTKEMGSVNESIITEGTNLYHTSSFPVKSTSKYNILVANTHLTNMILYGGVGTILSIGVILKELGLTVLSLSALQTQMYALDMIGCDGKPSDALKSTNTLINNAPVHSIQDGEVILTSKTASSKLMDILKLFGNCIVIKHDTFMYSLYAHLSKFNCKVGDKIKRDQVIGYVGNTGNSSQPHLHFQVCFTNPSLGVKSGMLHQLTPLPNALVNSMPIKFNNINVKHITNTPINDSNKWDIKSKDAEWVWYNEIDLTSQLFGINLVCTTKGINRALESYDIVTEACKNVQEARKFVQEVGKLAKKYDANYFVVTDGASGTNNNGNPAVKVARDAVAKWERENGFDDKEDWRNDPSDMSHYRLNSTKESAIPDEYYSDKFSDAQVVFNTLSEREAMWYIGRQDYRSKKSYVDAPVVKYRRTLIKNQIPVGTIEVRGCKGIEYQWVGVFIGKDYRHQGYSKILFNHMLDDYKPKGKIRWHVEFDNKVSQHTAESLGFKQVPPKLSDRLKKYEMVIE